jgi:hypothetical protein
MKWSRFCVNFALQTHSVSKATARGMFVSRPVVVLSRSLGRDDEDVARNQNHGDGSPATAYPLQYGSFGADFLALGRANVELSASTAIQTVGGGVVVYRLDDLGAKSRVDVQPTSGSGTVDQRCGVHVFQGKWRCLKRDENDVLVAGSQFEG